MMRNGVDYKTSRERFKDFVLAEIESHIADWQLRDGEEGDGYDDFAEGAVSALQILSEMIADEDGLKQIETRREAA